MASSRRIKKLEKKQRNTLILSIAGIVAVLFLLFRYGLPLISDASFLFGKVVPDGKEEKNEEEDNYVPPPSVESLPKATKSQNIKVGGTSLADLKIVLFVNGSEEGETTVDSEGSFEFSVRLSEGENIIKAKAVSGDNESEFSESQIVLYKNTPPEISIESPKDGDKLSGPNTVNVSGKADPDTNVTVNGFQAIISGENWSYRLTVKDGENEIKVVAEDLAGNRTEKTIKISYSP
jgi:hypothetical protein